ncbi:MAG: sensor histidine kinase N-terminal domain-containing protein [Comamonadaceae bacterium]|nr:sensor histidine kinase N-terminal domain-containing protein [Comamonadaceae bacterium]
MADEPGADLARGAGHRQPSRYDRELGEFNAAGARAGRGDRSRQRAVQLRRCTPGRPRDLLRADDSDRVYYQVLGARGELVSGERDLPRAARRATRPSAGRVLLRDDVMRGDDGARGLPLAVDARHRPERAGAGAGGRDAGQALARWPPRSSRA